MQADGASEHAAVNSARLDLYDYTADYALEECRTADCKKGITVSQGESVTAKGWEECYKVADYGKVVIIYITVNNGIILPKAAIGSQYGEFVKLAGEHLPGRLKKI